MINSELHFLYRALNSNELDVFNQYSEKLEKLKSSTQLNPDMLRKINLQRVLASSTLKKQRELEMWDEANKFLFECLGTNLSFEFMCKLNSVLTNESALRESEIYGAGFMYLKKKFLKSEIENLDHIICDKKCKTPLERALKIYIWVVSVHPFKNANGRTARLMADKILLENDYLPLCFADSRSSHCAYFNELKNNDLETKIEIFFKGLMRGYTL